MFIFSRQKYWAYIIIGCFLTTLFCLFEYFDYKISSSLNHNIVNWFTITFANFASFIVAITIHVGLFLLINLLFNKISKKYRIPLLVSLQLLTLTLYISYLFIGNAFKKQIEITFSQKVYIALISLMICYLVAFTIWWIVYVKCEQINIPLKSLLMYIIFLFAASIITQINKSFFGRNRPISVFENGTNFFYALEPNFSKIRGKSFNSGHANAACMLLGLNYLLLSSNWKFKKLFMNIIIWTIIILTALSRVLIWAHWTTDVAFSIILNILAYYLIYYLFNRKKGTIKNG